MPEQKTILIAEDNAGLLKALTVRLEAVGYRVVGVRDGYQALERCRRERPDLLLMDINMPAGSGLSVQERMLQTPEMSRIPVVYLTGETDQQVVGKAYELGAIAVIAKPVKTGELITVVASALSDSDSSAA